jgi:hypothetical protein
MFFGFELRLFERILVVVNLILVVGILVVFWLGFGQDLVENCWDKYQTEFEAISHCEK